MQWIRTYKKFLQYAESKQPRQKMNAHPLQRMEWTKISMYNTLHCNYNIVQCTMHFCRVQHPLHIHFCGKISSCKISCISAYELQGSSSNPFTSEHVGYIFTLCKEKQHNGTDIYLQRIVQWLSNEVLLSGVRANVRMIRTGQPLQNFLQFQPTSP